MDWLQILDVNILLFIQENIRLEALNGFFKAITFLGDKGWFWIAVSIILLIPKKTRSIGLMGLLSLALGALITNVWLKNVVERPRPFAEIEGLTILIQAPHDFSFPSGHTCASFAAASVYYKMLPKKYGIPALFLAALIGVSRLYLGVHYPTDILAGFIVGVISGLIVCWLYGKFEKKFMKKVRN